jgi:SHS2 domain-containing protein
VVEPGEGWERWDTGTGVGIRAWGPTCPVAFAHLVQGVFALIVVPELAQERESRAIRAQGGTPERLLAELVRECLYVHEIEGFVARRVEIELPSDGVASGLLHGEEIVPERHQPSPFPWHIGSATVSVSGPSVSCTVTLVIAGEGVA